MTRERRQPELEEALFEVGEELVGDARTEDLVQGLISKDRVSDLTERERRDLEDMRAGQLAAGLDGVDARVPDWRDAHARWSSAREVEYVRITPENLEVVLNVVDRLSRYANTLVLEHEMAPDTEVRLAKRPVLVYEKTWHPPDLRLVAGGQFLANYRTEGEG